MAFLNLTGRTANYSFVHNIDMIRMSQILHFWMDWLSASLKMAHQDVEICTETENWSKVIVGQKVELTRPILISKEWPPFPERNQAQKPMLP